jgi:acyl-CoA synthetase (AMP-forming)/AMP-acid ligase II
MHGYKKEDRIFTPMPLYHSGACFLSICSSWSTGTCVIIGRKFSARNFFDEARRGKATIMQVRRATPYYFY